MKKFIYKYLNAHYYLNTSDLGNDGIYPLEQYSYPAPINCEKLIKEITHLFGYNHTRTKWIIHKWAKSLNGQIDLTFYWRNYFFFPKAKTVSATIIGTDLISVTPMAKPNINLVYMDYVYGADIDENPMIISHIKPRKEQQEFNKLVDEMSLFYNQKNYLLE